MASSSLKPRYIIDSSKAEEAVSFYKYVFGATEVERVDYHRVEINVAGNVIQIEFENSDEKKEQKKRKVERNKVDGTNNSSNPVPSNGFEVCLAMQPEKVLETINRARASEVTDKTLEIVHFQLDGRTFYHGEHLAYFTDVYGFKWSFSAVVLG